MAQPLVLVENISEGIVRIALNRPHVLNALNVELLNSLVEALKTHAKAKIVILEGSGDRAFCSGEDLKQTLAPKTGSAEELRFSFEKLQDLTRLTSTSSAIVIAAVQGYAIGGGAEIALASDFVIGGPNAKFKFPEASIGHAVTGGISLRLVQIVGLLRAKELFLTGRMVDADEGLRIGLLTEVTSDPKQRAMQLAFQMAKTPAVSISMSKLALERAVFPNLESVLQDEINVASYCFSQADAQKAFSNFAQRRLPVDDAASEVRDLNEALRQAVRKHSSKTFLRFVGRDIIYSDFDLDVAKLAGGLRKLGIGRDDKILVMMRNSVEMVHTWFATMRLGAIWVPINLELKSVTLQHVIESAEAKIAIIDPEFFHHVLSTRVFQADAIIINGGTGPANLQSLYVSGECVETPENVSPSTVAAYLYTSGTTGRSKPCILSHQYFVQQGLVLTKSLSITGADVLYCPFPLFHADATALTTVPALLTGATAALSVRFSVSRFWDEIRATKATVYDFMGATLALVYKQEPSDQDRNHNVRLAWGVPVPSWAPKYESRFGHPIKELYGSVEVGIAVTQRGQRIAGSCGTAWPGYHLRITDDDDMPLLANTVGQLLIRSDLPNALFKGYFNCPEQTLDAFRNLWFHTGDLAKLDEDGNLYFLGRTKDVIRRRGENVNAFEVEEEILRHPDVITAAAIAVPSQLGDGAEDDIKVVVVVREGSQAQGFNERRLWEWCGDNMARFQVPAVIEFVSELKKTPTGKVEKGQLAREGGVRFDMMGSA